MKIIIGIILAISFPFFFFMFIENAIHGHLRDTPWKGILLAELLLGSMLGAIILFTR